MEGYNARIYVRDADTWKILMEYQIFLGNDEPFCKVATLTPGCGKPKDGVRLFKARTPVLVEIKGYWSDVNVREGNTWKDQLETFNITPAPAATPSPAASPSNQ
jgi:hypothetical protein